MTSAQRLEVVRDDKRLHEVGPAWTALWTRTGGFVFQSHAWVLAWFTTLPARERQELRIVLAWQGDQLAAVLPLAIRRKRGLRVLQWAAKDVCDYCDALIIPGSFPGLLQKMWALISAEGGYDIVYLGQLLPDAAARTLIHGDADNSVRLSPSHRSESCLSVLRSWPDGQSWLASLPKKVRQNYRRGQKYIGERGTLKFSLVETPEKRARAIELLAAQKRHRLTAEGANHALFSEGAPMLPALVDVLDKAGLLRLFVLECDEKIIAITINFVQGNRMMAFLTSYDPGFERGSPGMMLIVDYVQWSLDHGIGVIDFMRGAESFKFRFANEQTMLGSCLGSRTLAGAAAVALDRSIHALRRRWNDAAKRYNSKPVAPETDDANPHDLAGKAKSVSSVPAG